MSDSEAERCRSHNCRTLMSEILPIFDFLFTIGLWKRKLRPEIEEEVAKYNFMELSAYSRPPYIPPKSPTQSAGPPR